MLFSFKITIITIAMMFNKGNIYSDTFIVVETTQEWVTCVDFSGNEWAFENVAQDWEIGDIASVTMYDNDTPIIYDDVILSAKYSGWISGSWGYDAESGEPIVIFEN